MRRLLTPLLAVLCASSLGACGDTLQDRPISHNVLEGMISAPFPVYWLGGRFRDLAITEALHDPSGAYVVQYGNCVQGGQGTCTPPLRIVTSPDNSFLPGASVAQPAAPVRGVPALLGEDGRAIAIGTGPVVVDVYGSSPALARAAAQSLAPINRPASPGEALPARLPDTGYGSTPLPSQRPTAVAPLG